MIFGGLLICFTLSKLKESILIFIKDPVLRTCSANSRRSSGKRGELTVS